MLLVSAGRKRCLALGKETVAPGGSGDAVELSVGGRWPRRKRAPGDGDRERQAESGRRLDAVEEVPCAGVVDERVMVNESDHRGSVRRAAGSRFLLPLQCGRCTPCDGKREARRRGEGCLRRCSRPSVRGCIHSHRSETSRVRLAASPGELARRRPRGLGPARKLHCRGGPVLLCGAGPCAEPTAGGRTVRGTGSGRRRRPRANRLWTFRHRSGRWFPAAVRRCSGCR